MNRLAAIKTFKNILLIQLGDIGDVVLTTPTVRAVKETCPEARVSVLVFKPYGSLLAADPNLYEVLETARVSGSLFYRLHEFWRFARHLRNERYDMTIDLRTGDRGAILSFTTGARIRIGRQGIEKQFWHGLFFTHTIHDLKVAPPPVHPGADQSLRVVRELGIDTADSTPKLYIADAVRHAASTLLAQTVPGTGSRFVTINPFSRWKYKEWDNRKWGEVIDRLWEAHHLPAVLIGSAEEAAGCQEIVSGREGRAFNLAGKTSLAELAAVISASSLHLGVDSAAPHIAAALSTPTVTIHGPTNWRGWRISDEHHRIVSAAMDCVPCGMMGCEGSGESRCLDDLDAEPVIAAAIDVLRSRD